jgi:RTX calcium-binding nonapeptide repeat (4 copies)
LRWVRLTGLLFILLAATPTASSGGSRQVYPGCGETFKACVSATPPGGKIVLNTNKLLTVPKDLTIRKSLTVEAGDGFKPKIGRQNGVGQFSFENNDENARVVLRGIHFQDVGIRAQFKKGTENTFQFVDNTIDLNTHSNGSNGVSALLLGDARGSVVIRNNDISSSGTGIQTLLRGGSLSVIGNTVTASVFEDGSSGIDTAFPGRRSTTVMLASNLIHDEAGCFCGSSAGLDFYVYDSASVNASILNNTIDGLGSTGMQSNGIDIRTGHESSNGEVVISLFNNIVTNTARGIQVIADSQLTMTGNTNNTYDNLQSDLTGGYNLGTTLHQDPAYLDAPSNDFRLQSNSSMGGGGTTCIAQTPLPRLDAANRFRLEGHGVDIGAYELNSLRKGTIPGRNKSGTTNADVLAGTDGTDILCGLGQNDGISGGKGADFIFGGLDNDILHGQGGPDFVTGDENADQTFGGGGPDFLDVFDGQGIDSADGQGGDDTCAFDSGDVITSCEH